MVDELFKFKKANSVKLLNYGFQRMASGYRFQTHILNGQFTLSVCVSDDGTISTKIVDNEFQDEYTLHLVKDSAGEYVGKVRSEYESVLTDICNKCYENDVFKSRQSKQIINYVSNKYGDELEYLWKSFPSNAVLRRKDNNKWYAALLVVSKRKLGVNNDEVVEILDLRLEPDKIRQVIDNQTYFAGYHMNKQHWFSVCLDGSAPIDDIFAYIDNSFRLAK